MLGFNPSRKTKILFRLLLALFIVCLAIYAVGITTQLIQVLISKTLSHTDFNPIICFQYAFNFKYSGSAWIGLLVLAIVLAAYMFSMRDSRGRMDSGLKKDKNLDFEYSGKENYGSARLMTENEVRKNYRVVQNSVSGMMKTDGSIVFGFLNDKQKEIVSMPESDWRKATDFNRNIAVCGPPGSNKTRGFVMNYLIQKLTAGESIIVVDTKGELYAKTYKYAKSKGYTCKILNLIEQEHSDGWDILNEVRNNPDMATELAATTIRNTGGKMNKDFWDIAEENLLKSIILLKSVGQADISNILGKKQTMGDVYKYIATRKIFIKDGGGESMEADFKFLQEYIPNHPALTPFLQFTNAGNEVCKQIAHGLANRLQLFQNAQLSNVLGTKDIDFELAGRSKCIYYLRFSDQTSTYAFITALFFSFLAVKLVGYADSCEDRRLPVPVNLVLDEFCNIGAIPDFEKKMATFRSRMINVVLIYQNNMLFESTYPNGLWEAILATCDTFVVLGVGNELTTGKYVSEMTGEATTSVSSSSLTTDTGQLRTTSSTGKRFVMTPDEIRRHTRTKALVFVTSYRVMEVVKMDYTLNPIYIENKSTFDDEVSVVDHNTIVEKVDVRYEDYIIDGIQREAYKSRVSDNSSDNNDKPSGRGRGNSDNTADKGHTNNSQPEKNSFDENNIPGLPRRKPDRSGFGKTIHKGSSGRPTGLR